MNWIIEKVLRPKIATLSFIERYGGVVEQIKVNEGNKTKSFPVSSYLSHKQCFEDGLYNALTPDDKYKSVSYFETISNKGPTYGGVKGNEISVQTRMRFVCWLNLQKLGIDTHINRLRYILAVSNTIKGRHSFDVDGIKGVIDVNEFNVPEQKHEAVFGKYSYGQSRSDGRDSYLRFGNTQKFFFYPFAFFAMDVSIKLKTNAACVPAMEAGTPLSCPPSVILPEITSMAPVWVLDATNTAVTDDTNTLIT